MKRIPALFLRAPLLPALLVLPALPTVALSLPGTPLHAQTTLSFMAGLNRTSLDVDTDEAFSPDFKSLTRMSVGLAVTVPVSDRFGIQLGGRYAQKGGRLDVIGVLETIGGTMGDFEDMPAGTSVNADIGMDYFELSVLARVGVPLSGDRVSGHLLAGPALGRQSSCSGSVSFRGPDAPGIDVSEDCDEFDIDSRKSDFGLVGGAGIDIRLTDSIDAQLGVLHTFGLSDISEEEGETTRHRALTIQAGLAMPIG